jgi:hypothetical protein
MTSYAISDGGIDRGMKFILTVVDFFSRKVWLRPLKTQTAVNARNALRDIVTEKPRHIPASYKLITAQNLQKKRQFGWKMT